MYVSKNMTMLQVRVFAIVKYMYATFNITKFFPYLKLN